MRPGYARLLLKHRQALGVHLHPSSLVCLPSQTRCVSDMAIALKARRDSIIANEGSSYPRIGEDTQYTRIKDASIIDISRTEENIIVRGRVTGTRKKSSTTHFYDIEDDGHVVQVMLRKDNVCNYTEEEWDKANNVFRKGDIISVLGRSGEPHGEKKQPLVIASEFPTMLCAPLQPPPPTLQHIDKRFAHRHVDLMINQEAKAVLYHRHLIISYIRKYLSDNDFVEVQTPILASLASGAVARPFTTMSSGDKLKKDLQLRIAPELWLKRLVISGLDRIYELGVSFRNENADRTHNPEFTTCEFYEAYTGLKSLMNRTEQLLNGLAQHLYVENRIGGKKGSTSLVSICKDVPTIEDFQLPFRQIDFIPALEQKLGNALPDLDGPDAFDFLSKQCSAHNIPKPRFENVPNLLDALASHFLEPTCVGPTFIINIPACLSPLSKTSVVNGNRIAHRAELYFRGFELANLYEEENNPLEQRRKFEEQLKYREGDQEKMDLDESYLQALEYGLPPTGGWGMGIDRLCMLMLGLPSISDTMAFGGLRGVLLTGNPPKHLKITEG